MNILKLINDENLFVGNINLVQMGEALQFGPLYQFDLQPLGMDTPQVLRMSQWCRLQRDWRTCRSSRCVAGERE